MKLGAIRVEDADVVRGKEKGKPNSSLAWKWNGWNRTVSITRLVPFASTKL